VNHLNSFLLPNMTGICCRLELTRASRCKSTWPMWLSVAFSGAIYMIRRMPTRCRPSSRSWMDPWMPQVNSGKHRTACTTGASMLWSRSIRMVFRWTRCVWRSTLTRDVSSDLRRLWKRGEEALRRVVWDDHWVEAVSVSGVQMQTGQY